MTIEQMTEALENAKESIHRAEIATQRLKQQYAEFCSENEAFSELFLGEDSNHLIDESPKKIKVVSNDLNGFLSEIVERTRLSEDFGCLLLYKSVIENPCTPFVSLFNVLNRENAELLSDKLLGVVNDSALFNDDILKKYNSLKRALHAESTNRSEFNARTRLQKADKEAVESITNSNGRKRTSVKTKTLKKV